MRPNDLRESETKIRGDDNNEGFCDECRYTNHREDEWDYQNERERSL